MRPFMMSCRATEVIDVDAPSEGNVAWLTNTKHESGTTPGRSHENPIILDHSLDIKTPRKRKTKKRSHRKISKDENATNRSGSPRFSGYKKLAPPLGSPKDDKTCSDKEEGSAATPLVSAVSKTLVKGSAERPPCVEPPPRIVRVTDRSKSKRHPPLVFLPIPFP